MICSPIRACASHAVRFSGCAQRKMTNRVGSVMCQTSPTSFYFSQATGFSQSKSAQLLVSKTNSSTSIIQFRGLHKSSWRSCISTQGSDFHSLKVKNIDGTRKQPQQLCLDFSYGRHNMNVKVVVPRKARVSEVKCKMGGLSWSQTFSTTGLLFGLLVCSSTSEPLHAEAHLPDENRGNSSFSHGKKVCTDYSVIGIPGDGRCMFRSVAHGACLRSGKGAPDERLQRELADELRARVADEFVKRREETEWFIEGNFDTYVTQIRKSHVWGGEPELLMASHVLKMPITVYMHDEDSGGLIAIAEYGQEYSKENPIPVLYHGFGHYDALQIPCAKGARSKL